MDLPLSNLELIDLIDNVKRSLNSASISAELDLTLGKVTNDRDFSLDTAVTSQGLEVRE